MRNVILEGCDGSGKSTLARSLTFYLNMRVQEGMGPGKSQGELDRRVHHYLGMENTIFDRHPIISQPIYNQFRTDAPIIQHNHQAWFQSERSQYLIVYCEGAVIHHHIEKTHETQEHLLMVREKFDQIILAYREWAWKNADIIYRTGEDMGLVGRMIKGGL